MISKKMSAAINKQINAELYSSYMYFAMSAAATDKNLTGTAKWFFVQGREEMSHAWIMMNYLNEQGARVKLAAIAEPPADYDSIKDMFEKTLAHEQKVTAMINNLVTLAIEEKDYASQGFLQWFVKEQVEEEANDKEILGKIGLVGASTGAMYMLDRELGKREFHMPSALAEG